MGKFDGVLLVSDFDDTLYDSHCQVPRRNLEALDRFLAQGGRFTVATGRAHRTFAPYVHLAPVNAPVVLSNGSAIYDFQKDEFLVQTYLSPSAPQDLDGVMEAFPQLGMEAYHGEDIYVFRPNWITDLHMKKVGTDYTVCPIREMPTPWTKAILQTAQENNSPVILGVSEGAGKYMTGYKTVYLEITDHGCNKGGMVARLAQMLGIARENIYCVGDNQNDIPMMALSAVPFAPANCAQEVKDWGAHILCHCDDGVIGDIVEILEQRY